MFAMTLCLVLFSKLYENNIIYNLQNRSIVKLCEVTCCTSKWKKEPLKLSTDLLNYFLHFPWYFPLYNFLLLASLIFSYFLITGPPSEYSSISSRPVLDQPAARFADSEIAVPKLGICLKAFGLCFSSRFSLHRSFWIWPADRRVGLDGAGNSMVSAAGVAVCFDFTGCRTLKMCS